MKKVIITGATRGLGLSIAKQLCEAGYYVIGTGRTCSNELSTLIEQYPTQLHFEPLDLSKDPLRDTVKTWTKKHGAIYGLINNAALGHDGVLGTMHESEISETIFVNLTATITLTKYVSRSMLLAGEGRIVNISSIIANTGFNGLSVYAASKAGLIGFTKSLARELGKANITVNALCPGYMKTDMTQGISEEKLATIVRRSPLKRLADTDNVAQSVVYLLAPHAIDMTGTCLTIDAGSTA